MNGPPARSAPSPIRHCRARPGNPSSSQNFLRRGWTRGSSPRVTEGLRGATYRPSHRLDEHGAALAAADAFGGDALADAEPLHCVDQMQHDAVAARADGMAQADRTAVDVELVAGNAPGGGGKPEHFLAKGVVLPGGEAGEHLRGEGFVDLPQADVAERKRMPAQDRARAQHRAEPHDGRIERRPRA